MQLSFVDLRPIPSRMISLSKQHFLVLISHLVNSKPLDGQLLMDEMRSVDVETMVDVLERFDHWKGHDVLLKGKSILDIEGLVPALRTVAIHNCISVSYVLFINTLQQPDTQR